MTNNHTISPVAIGYLVTIPLAMVVGFALSNPLSTKSIGILFMVLSVLASPIVLRWHHTALVVSWNAALVIFFLPGQPMLWAVLSGLSLCISVVSRTIMKKSTFLLVPSVSTPLVILAIVVLATAMLTGGIGGRALGSDMWGAKRYLGVIGAVMGFFAITAHPIRREDAQILTGAFLLMGMTAIFADIAYMLGPAFYFLYNFFPVDLAFHTVASQDTLKRSTGFAWASQAAYWFMLMRYGLRGILDPQKPWRIVAFFGIFVVGLIGGFRSSIILFGILTISQFFIEKLHKTRYLPIFAGASLIVGMGLIIGARHLPLSMQRALSFLPIEVHPMARNDADGTLHWRLEMWRIVAREVPDYLVLGKGYGFSGTDYVLTQEAIRRGMFRAYEDTLISGNYHNGILTLLVPFGLGGFICFCWFIWASLRVLMRNYRYSPQDLKNINTFLLAFFLARLGFYLVFYGQFDLDLMIFTGTVALSISLNHGVRSRQDLEKDLNPPPEEPAPTPLPNSIPVV